MTVTDDKVLAEIAWFNRQLLYLKDTFIAWLKEESHDVDVSEENIVNNEQPSGPYNTFKYTITIEAFPKLQFLGKQP